MNRTDIKISVIIPIYNMEKYISQCVESAVNQTLEEIEIICVDDGSTDKSPQLLANYAQKDERVVVIVQSNQGVSAARNAGIAKAKGEYILVFDADDYMEEDMLKNAYICIKENDADICIFRARECEGDSVLGVMGNIRAELRPKENCVSPKNLSDRLFSLGPLWAWDKLYKREIIQSNAIEFQNIRSTNDARFVCEAFSVANKICFCDNAYAIHRVNRMDSISKTRGEKWDCFYKAIQSTEDKLKERGTFDEYIKAFRNWVLDFSIWNLDTIVDKQQEVQDCLVNEIFPRYQIIEQGKDYYLYGEQYEKALQIMDGVYVDLKNNINAVMSSLFEKCSDTDKVIIYGAGKWGRYNAERIQRGGVPAKQILIVDRNWRECSLTNFEVHNPDWVDYGECDKIIIAVESESATTSIKGYLLSKGVSPNKIVSRL